MTQVALVFSDHPHTNMHAATLRLLEEVSAVHVCAIEGADAGPVVGAIGSKARAATLDESLRDVDALLLCARNDLTPGILRRAVEAEKPVLFEKPGAVRAADLKEIARLARQKNVTLGAILPWRFHPISQELKRLHTEGAFGQLLAVEARMVTSQVRYRDPQHWLFDPARGGGILSWLGIHWLDLLHFLLGQRVTRVTALASRRNPERVKVEDTAALTFEYEDGTLGTLHAGYLLPGSQSGYRGAAYDNYLALRGYDGWATWPMTTTPGAYTLFSTSQGNPTDGQEERRFELPQSEAYSGAHGLRFVRAFLDAAKNHQPAPCPIEDLIHSLDVIEAALKASASGQTQSVTA
ncbi:MAG TPA: Gfo/Idh/MocA family oxidoreductase [Chloroflexota bacterium]|nr:Gfo/Idh/MocA family oxidoreductase [Chloroflexota bacterium]